MGAEPPVDYGKVGYQGERIVEAHRFFGEQAREWLRQKGSSEIQARSAAIETTVWDLIHMVVIDLAADENAQKL